MSNPSAETTKRWLKSAEVTHAEIFFKELMSPEATYESLLPNKNNIAIALQRLKDGEVESEYSIEEIETRQRALNLV